MVFLNCSSSRLYRKIFEPGHVRQFLTYDWNTILKAVGFGEISIDSHLFSKLISSTKITRNPDLHHPRLNKGIRSPRTYVLNEVSANTVECNLSTSLEVIAEIPRAFMHQRHTNVIAIILLHLKHLR